ncbi:hypothetical protein [Nocardioides sp. Root190]|uniref:hypothetical protein n=1 Tax=Nocardioides sp. Root190 TaxID=1736488 RepID=UPI000AA0DDAD|nr:hypothetical protein [Nocardioides sp. Root190]
MRSRRTNNLPIVLDALALPEDDPATRRLADAFGGQPAAVTERRVGVPTRRSRHLQFASGGEIWLHDDTVVAVVLRLEPTPVAPRGIDLSDWLGIDDRATLEQLGTVMGTRPRFAGFGTPYFTIDGGFARATFRDDRGWKEPGNLLSLAFTVEQPGLAIRPEDDDCPTCSDLLARGDDDEQVDVDATTAALADAVAAGLLTEDTHWVRLADLRPLHASGLMERAESQLTCTTCRRIICFTLLRNASPTFGFHVLDDARRRPLGEIPPVDQWGDAARIEQERDAMQYVDHEPAAWFLVQQRGVLHLQARYTRSAMVDDSVLVRLDESELTAYRTGGHDYLSALARAIHDSAPYDEASAYHARNLYRQPGAKELRATVGAAIVNHTWLAQQRR